jgi:hypothetical protein
MMTGVPLSAKSSYAWNWKLRICPLASIRLVAVAPARHEVITTEVNPVITKRPMADATISSMSV